MQINNIYRMFIDVDEQEGNELMCVYFLLGTSPCSAYMSNMQRQTITTKFNSTDSIS